jgi:signal transduction histidine kinase
LRQLLSRAGGTLQRVRQMVADLLEFARAAARPPPGVETEVEPLLQCLAGDLEPLAADAGVALHVGSAPELRVPCAAGILSSVLSNLVQNAIRYAGKGTEHRVDVRAAPAGPEVRFEVEDTGPGIPPEDRERIFDPYVSRGEGGSGLGLGLATVKRLAESHGGHVGVSCVPGHGALFWVTLPKAG